MIRETEGAFFDAWHAQKRIKNAHRREPCIAGGKHVLNERPVKLKEMTSARTTKKLLPKT